MTIGPASLTPPSVVKRPKLKRADDSACAVSRPRARSTWAGPGLPSSRLIASGRGQALDPLDEVQHVAAGPAAEAVELLGASVHREAAFGLVVEGADPLAASGRVSRIM